MKKKKRLTRRERKEVSANKPQTSNAHIHCVACGRHLDVSEFTNTPASARYLSCQHGRKFPVCVGCVVQGQRLLDEHDRTGTPVRAAAAWH